jgi:hypothetical protein
MAPSGDQAAVIAFLSDGAAYGRPGTAVTRIDTHASIVFLVGDRVYKLKRAVRFSYLDYSTVAKREAMCRAEFRLNRRTAPALYLGVRAVMRRGDGALALDGGGDAGETVDWLLEMTRFDEADLFDRMAEGNRLAPALLRDLADVIAAFHGAAEICGVVAYGTAMRTIARESIANLEATGAALEQGEVAALATATDAALTRLAPLLDARGDGGAVRRCHGDLHLGNIYLLDGKPTLFDGIEFNDAFTCIDTLYDLAFLLMDLNHRGLDDGAAILFNHYLDRGAGDGALALLPLYLSIRAGVRAHVSIATLSRQSDAEKKDDLARAASRYLVAARDFLRPAQPRLIAVGGRSGSGKSTIALGLAPAFAPAPGARVLRTDMLRKRAAGVTPETRLPPSAYDPATHRLVYEHLFRAAAETLAAGYSVIADGAFLDPAERDAIADVARQGKVPFTGLWLEAPPDRLRRRIAARRGDASDADLRVLESQLGRDPGPLSWRRIAAGDDVAMVLGAAREAVDQGAG